MYKIFSNSSVRKNFTWSYFGENVDKCSGSLSNFTSFSFIGNFIKFYREKKEPFLKHSEKMGRKQRSWWNISSRGSWKIVFHKQTHDKRWRICWFSGPKQQKPISADVSEIWNIGRLHYWVCDREWVSAFIQRRIVSFRYNKIILSSVYNKYWQILVRVIRNEQRFFARKLNSAMVGGEKYADDLIRILVTRSSRGDLSKILQESNSMYGNDSLQSKFSGVQFYCDIIIMQRFCS